MGAPRKTDLDRRLEAYFATLRPTPLRDVIKRSAANWPIYAAVTGRHGDADRRLGLNHRQRRTEYRR